MNTFIWGPLLWDLLFVICFYLDHVIEIRDRDERKAIKSIVTGILASLKVLIPCALCRPSYKYFLEEKMGVCPPVSAKKKTRAHQHPALEWIYTFKNLVNQKLHNNQEDFLSFNNFVLRMHFHYDNGKIFDRYNYFTLLMLFGYYIYNPNEYSVVQKVEAYAAFYNGMISFFRLAKIPIRLKKIAKADLASTFFDSSAGNVNLSALSSPPSSMLRVHCVHFFDYFINSIASPLGQPATKNTNSTLQRISNIYQLC